MITTVTPNPSLDRTLHLSRLAYPAMSTGTGAVFCRGSGSA